LINGHNPGSLSLHAIMPPRSEGQFARNRLPEARSTSAHDLTLAHEFGVELGSVKREIDVKVNTVKCALRRVHTLEVFFEILAAEIRGESDDFLDA
jgi:hypothetical protein